MQILQASNPRLHVKVLALRHSIPEDARPPGAREVLACQRSAKQRHGRGATLSARQKFLGEADQVAAAPRTENVCQLRTRAPQPSLDDRVGTRKITYHILAHRRRDRLDWSELADPARGGGIAKDPARVAPGAIC